MRSNLSNPEVWAVVPVKDFQQAKQRLAPALTPFERQNFFCAMFEDVLRTLGAAPRLAGVVVVTRDPAARRLAQRYQARVLEEAVNRGHTAAAAFAAQTLAKEGVGAMVQLPADIPAMTVDDVAAILSTLEPRRITTPTVTIVPARDERGSNAVLCAPPDALPLRFGNDSFHPHLQSARDRGIEPQVIKRAGIALDVDTPQDLAHFLSKPSATCAYRYLLESGVANRFFRSPGGSVG